jgi:hypothetical protein
MMKRRRVIAVLLSSAAALVTIFAAAPLGIFLLLDLCTENCEAGPADPSASQVTVLTVLPFAALALAIVVAVSLATRRVRLARAAALSYAACVLAYLGISGLLLDIGDIHTVGRWIIAALGLLVIAVVSSAWLVPIDAATSGQELTAAESH